MRPDTSRSPMAALPDAGASSAQDGSSSSREREQRSLLRALVWRGSAFLVVYLAAIVGMAMGAGASERDIVGAGLAEKAYYALGLFVLGGLDIGTPVGGPTAARGLLWIAYFLAPIITASAIVEAVVRLVDPMTLRVRRFSDHVILGGAGRLTLLYVRKLRAGDRKRRIVVVEREATHPRFPELRDVHGAVIVRGDVASDEVLRRIRVERAHRVLLLTGDNFSNLDAAAKILGRAKRMAGRVVVHVSDLGLIRQTAGSSVARHCDIFNGHEFAAVHLVQEHLLERFHGTPGRDPVVLAGFGRFGQTVLDQLQKHAAGKFGPVIVLDQRAHDHARAFEAGPGFADDYQRAVINGDLLNPDIWTRIDDVLRSTANDPVVIVGSGDDGTNLRAALAVRSSHPGAYVIVRNLRSSPFTDEIVQEAGAQSFNLGELIQSGMPARWF